MRIDISSYPFVFFSIFSEVVKNYWRRILFQGRVGLWGIDEDTLVISKDIFRKINVDSHHTKFVAQSSYIFTALFHCDQLWAKVTRFFRDLAFRELVDQIRIDIYDETSVWVPSGEFTIMARVYKCLHFKANTTMFLNVGVDVFRELSISASTPIIKRKLWFIDFRSQRVEN